MSHNMHITHPFIRKSNLKINKYINKIYTHKNPYIMYLYKFKTTTKYIERQHCYDCDFCCLLLMFMFMVPCMCYYIKPKKTKQNKHTNKQINTK